MLGCSRTDCIHGLWSHPGLSGLVPIPKTPATVYLSPPSLGESASFVTAMHLHTFWCDISAVFHCLSGHMALSCYCVEIVFRGCLRNREASDGQGLIPNWGRVNMKAQLPWIHWHDQLTPGAYESTTQCQFCLVGRDREPQWINSVRIHAFAPPKVVLPHCSCCSAVEDILVPVGKQVTCTWGRAKNSPKRHGERQH